LFQPTKKRFLFANGIILGWCGSLVVVALSNSKHELKSIYFILYIRNNTLAIITDVGLVIWLDFAVANLALHSFTINAPLIKSIIILSHK